MRTLRSLVVLAALLAAFPSPAYEPTGSLDYTAAGGSGGATFDHRQVVGPQVTMSALASGGWGGELDHHGVRLESSATRLAGAGVLLSLSQRDGGLLVEGRYLGRRVRLTLTPGALIGRYGRCSFELKRSQPGLYVGDVGCQRVRGPSTTDKATFRLQGEAAGPEAPLPQLPLALLAALPS